MEFYTRCADTPEPQIFFNLGIGRKGTDISLTVAAAERFKDELEKCIAEVKDNSRKHRFIDSEKILLEKFGFYFQKVSYSGFFFEEFRKIQGRFYGKIYPKFAGFYWAVHQNTPLSYGYANGTEPTIEAAIGKMLISLGEAKYELKGDEENVF